MKDYFHPLLDPEALKSMNMLSLAHIGDAVYELCVREYLASAASLPVSRLHAMTVSMVNANYQAEAARKIQPDLTAEEADIFRRGRNCKVNSIPHNSSSAEYHAATGLEVLFGYLFLSGETERVNYLFSLIEGDRNGN